MSTKMVVSHQKITKRTKRRRRHARMWQQGTMFSRLGHIMTDCTICHAYYNAPDVIEVKHYL
jgi:hypothetical protein